MADRLSNEALVVLINNLIADNTTGQVSVADARQVFLAIADILRMGYGSLVKTVAEPVTLVDDIWTPIQNYDEIRPQTEEYQGDLVAGTINIVKPCVSLTLAQVSIAAGGTEKIAGRWTVDGAPVNVETPFVSSGPTEPGGGLLLNLIDTGNTPKLTQLELISRQGGASITIESVYILFLLFRLNTTPVGI